MIKDNFMFSGLYNWLDDGYIHWDKGFWTGVEG